MSDHAAWHVYVLTSERAERTYVGIALDPEKRLQEHNGIRVGGARSTRAYRPWKLATTYGPFENRSEACIAEARVGALAQGIGDCVTILKGLINNRNVSP